MGISFYGWVISCFMADVLLLSAKKRTSSAEVLGNAKDVFITRDLFIKKFLYHFCGMIELKNEDEKASPFGRGGGVADGEGKNQPSHPLSRELSQMESLV